MTRSIARLRCPSCRALFRRPIACCPLDGSKTVPLPPDPMIGETIGHGYRVVAVAGESKTSRRYHGLAPDGDPVEVRILFGELAAVSRHCLRFARASKLARRLDHPHLLRFFESGFTAAGLPYAVTEPMVGRSLAAIVDREAPLPAARAVRIGRGLCSGLGHAHARGVLVGGLAPSRVMVDGDHARVVDFGQARELASAWPQNRGDKLSGVAGYLAPEQATGGRVDGRADLFALGLIMYEMLAGAHPFDGVPLALTAQLASATPPPIRARAPAAPVTGPLEEVVMRLLARDPADRYPDSDAAGAALAAAVGQCGTG